MSTENPSKINQLLQSQPAGVVLLSSWMKKNGYSNDLQQRYKKSKWLKPIGSGAMIRDGDDVGYEGALYAIQKQDNLSVHPGGRTALALVGKAHYLSMGEFTVTLFGHKNEKLPAWFIKKNWDVTVDFHEATFLPPDLGLMDFEFKTFSIKISDSIRAIMECLYLAPHGQDLMECYELMENLNNLSPQKVQVLLENSGSVKVNRLFLYLADKVGHSWFRYLDTGKVYLGSGKRSIVSHGVLNKKYQITVPKKMEEIGKDL